MTLPQLLTPSQQAIADALEKHGELSLIKLKSATGLNFLTVNAALTCLLNADAIERRETEVSVLYRLKQPSLI